MNVGAIRLPGTRDSLPALAGFVKDVAHSAGLTTRSERRLLLAADEIVTNIVVHGFEEAQQSGQIQIEAEIDDDFLTLVVADDGASFDPRLAPEPSSLNAPLESRTEGGLGIYLALKQLDGFDYHRRDGRNINVLKTRRHHT